jgi:hypothetical protein
MHTAPTTFGRVSWRVGRRGLARGLACGLVGLAAPAAFTAAACGDGLGAARPGPDQESVAGVYVLQAVNGGSLPAFVPDGTRYGASLSADTLTLGADGTLAEVWYIAHSTGPRDTTRATGTWRVTASGVTLTYAALPYTLSVYPGPTYTGSVKGAGWLGFAAAPTGSNAEYAPQ